MLSSAALYSELRQDKAGAEAQPVLCGEPVPRHDTDHPEGPRHTGLSAQNGGGGGGQRRVQRTQRCAGRVNQGTDLCLTLESDIYSIVLNCWSHLQTLVQDGMCNDSNVFGGI